MRLFIKRIYEVIGKMLFLFISSFKIILRLNSLQSKKNENMYEKYCLDINQSSLETFLGIKIYILIG